MENSRNWCLHCTGILFKGVIHFHEDTLQLSIFQLQNVDSIFLYNCIS